MSHRMSGQERKPTSYSIIPCPAPTSFVCVACDHHISPMVGARKWPEASHTVVAWVTIYRVLHDGDAVAVLPWVEFFKQACELIARREERRRIKP